MRLKEINDFTLIAFAIKTNLEIYAIKNFAHECYFIWDVGLYQRD